MAYYTWTSNADRHDGTERVVLRGGSLVLVMDGYADLTSQEVAQLASYGIVLTPGVVPGSSAAEEEVEAVRDDDPRLGQIAYSERIAGWNAFTGDQSYANIEGLTIEFELDEDADVTVRASLGMAQISAAGNRVRVAATIDGTRKMNVQVQAGGFNAGQTQVFFPLGTLARTLRLATGIHWVQVSALHQSQSSGNTSAADGIWADLSSFSGGANEESALTLEALRA